MEISELLGKKLKTIAEQPTLREYLAENAKFLQYDAEAELAKPFKITAWNDKMYGIMNHIVVFLIKHEILEGVFEESAEGVKVLEMPPASLTKIEEIITSFIIEQEANLT